MPDPEEMDLEEGTEGAGAPGKEGAEGAEGAKAGAADDDAELMALINVDDFMDEPEEGAEANAGKGTDKKEGEAKGAAPDDKEAQLQDLIRKNKDLNRALHEERQRGKAKGDGKDEVVLTDQQIEGLLTEYKDDPKTLLNIIKYQAQVAAKGAAKDATTSADVAKRKQELEGFLYKNYPDLTRDDSDLRMAVNKAKTELGIEDHPFGEFFATAATNLMAMPHLLKNAYDKGRKDAEEGNAEKSRKELVKGSGLTPGKGKAKAEGAPSAPEMSDVAKRLGLKSPQQMALLRKLTASAKSTGARTVSLED